MEISNIRTNASPAFGAKFSGKNFKEVVEFAKETKQLRKLDNALNNILHANDGDILIIHGKAPNGNIYSNFTMGRRTVQNSALKANSPAEATFNGIIELGQLDRKFRSLVGGNVKENIKAEDIIARYSK